MVADTSISHRNPITKKIELEQGGIIAAWYETDTLFEISNRTNSINEHSYY